MNIKDVFGDAILTYEQFMEIAKDAKFVDLSEGQYVSKSKFDNEISGKTSEIDTLKTTLSQRDTDLKDLQSKLKNASGDADKVKTLSDEISKLQTKYEEDTEAYKKQLAEQAYTFAVKEYANQQKFSSGAARRDFERELIAQNLSLKDGVILGADDFVKTYAEANADAFIKAEEIPEDKPMFTKGFSQNSSAPDDTKGFASAFNFAGVRPQSKGE